MALKDLLQLNEKHKKIGISEERINAIKPYLRQYIAFWREYPDLFVDFLQTGGDPNIEPEFKFFAYQRVFLRVAMRYKYTYCVFPRGYSKSFLSVMVLMCRCILHPQCALFVTSGGKEQSAKIVQEKVQDICSKIPAFNRELDRRPGKTREGKDFVRYVFKNGSYFDNVAASERSRGLRRQGGVIEECVGVDGQILSEVILPMMNVSRRCADGTTQRDEVLNKSQIYITTSGYKNTFSYNKLIQLLVWMITEPEKSFIMGGTWRIPVIAGLQEKTFIQDMKKDGTFNEASFGREYESRWSGTVEDAFFNGEVFDRNRVLNQPEYEYSGRSTATTYYIISVDVGRKDCESVATIWKVAPQVVGEAFKSLVNIEVMENDHFETQALWLKKLFYRYKAKRLIIDGNGLGLGLMDYLVKPQVDPVTGDEYPDFGVYGGTYEGVLDDYKKFKTAVTEQDAIYVIKANAPINTVAHANVQTQMNAGKIRLLIDERLAKEKLLGTKVGQAMTPEERAEYLYPFTLTSILKEEMMNLREETEGLNIILKQANKRIIKDKFSAFEYGLYYIREEEESKKRKKNRRMSEFMFMN